MMTTRPVPTALIGPHVAQVRPIIQSPVPRVEPGISPMSALSTRPNVMLNGNSSVSPDSTIVPPGRYRYCAGLANGQQGIYLAPISTDVQNPNTKVFVPFSSTNPTPKLILPPTSPTIQIPNTSLIPSVQTPCVTVHSSTPTQTMQKTIPTGSFLNVASQRQDGSTPAKGTITPGAILLDNLATPVGNSVPPSVNVPLVITSLVNNTTSRSVPITTIPSMMASSQLLNIVQSKVGACKTTAANSSALIAPTRLTHTANVPSTVKKVASFNTMKTISTQPRFPGTLKIIVNNPIHGVSRQVAQVTTQAAFNARSANVTPAGDPSTKSAGTILLPQSLKYMRNQQPTSGATQHKTANISSPLPPMPADEQDMIIKQEVEDAGYNDNGCETESFNFKIDSVFSLSSSLTDEGSVKTEPDASPRCEYHDQHFVVLHKLDLKGLLSVDVRKFRKLTGRRSCTKKCREKTVNRFCRLRKLSVKRKLEPDSDDAMSADAKGEQMEEEENPEMDIFFARCKPAPKSHKLKLFRNAEKLMKRKPAPDKVKRGSWSPTKTSNTKTDSPHKLLPKCNNYMASAHASDHSSKQDHDYANKAVSLLNPGSKPVQGWVPMASGSCNSITSGASANLTPTTTVDAKSPAVLKAASSLGTKKFYLIKVEGKNILIPVEQTGLQPRAYVLGSDKNTKAVGGGNLSSVDPSQSAASIPTAVTTIETPLKTLPNAAPQKPPVLSTHTNAAPHLPAGVTIKTEPLHDSQKVITEKPTCEEINTSIPLQKIKPEPMRGYADEESSSPEPTSSVTDANTSERSIPAPDMTEAGRASGPPTSNTLFPGPVISTSADRIRKLKELIRKNEEELEQIRKKRKEEALEISSILDTDDL